MADHENNLLSCLLSSDVARQALALRDREATHRQMPNHLSDVLSYVEYDEGIMASLCLTLINGGMNLKEQTVAYPLGLRTESIAPLC